MHSSFAHAGGATLATPSPPSVASSPQHPPHSLSSSSLATLGGDASAQQIKDLLPGDSGARTDLLLGLLKNSYSSSLHAADVRMASLTQELVALRAQHAYAETKLRALEALAEEAGRAGEQQRRRGDALQQENVRLKADNQTLRAENAQLERFKALLTSAAAASGIPGTPANGSVASQLSVPAPYPAMLYASSNGQQQQPQQPAMQQYSAPHTHTISSADAEFRPHAPQPSSIATPQHHPQPQPAAAAQTFFFSPLKPQRPSESIALSSIPSAPHSHQTPLQPHAPRTGAGVTAYAMPSPLSADALNSPAPTPRPALHMHQQPHSTPATSADILSEINAHLDSSGRGRPQQSSPPARRSSGHGMNGFTPSSGGTMAAAADSHAFTSPAPVSSVAAHARALFQAAQTRLPAGVFGEFVSLVQQFRADSGSTAGSDPTRWDEIRQRAAALLGPWQDIHARFEQLLQASQQQQQAR